MRRLAPFALLALLVVAAWWLHQRAGEARRVIVAGRPRVEGRIQVAGAAAPLRILRDARGVPHVEALSERDAYFGLGFAHAQDRLGQMLSLLHSARGTRAATLGAEALAEDRWVRTLGLGALAERQAEALAPEVANLLDAYAAGIDARLARLRAGLSAPPAQFELDDLPERWTRADSLAILKIWSWGLGNSLETSLVLDDLVRSIGPARARPFFPAGAGIAPGPGGSRPEMVDLRGPRDGLRARAPLDRWRAPLDGFREPLRGRLGLRAPGVGSSAWVVAGSVSASGRPLLAGDAHFEPTVPGHFHAAHLRGGGLAVAGFALPGVPVFWSGANEHVVWASTASRASVMDLFVESVSPGGKHGKGRYHDGKRRQPLAVRSETLAVRGAADETFEVRSTPRGPLINPLLPAEREPLALSWAGAFPGDGIGPLTRAARAEDAAAFVAALADHHEPALAFVFVDDAGAGGRKVAGWVPRRGLPSGLVPVSARSSWAQWDAPVPAERLPARWLAAGEPFVIAADGPLEAGAGRQIEWLWRTGERDARIRERLEEAAADGPLTPSVLASIQAGLHSAGSDRILGPALTLAGSPAQLAAEAREVQAILANWDGETGPDSIGAAVYHVFLNTLVREMLEPALGEALFERYVSLVHANPLPLVARILAATEASGPGREAPPEWSRGRVAAAVRRTLRSTWLRFGVEVGPNREKWSWGRLHELRFRPFGMLRFRGAAEPELGPLPYAGDRTTIAVGGYDWLDPFEVRSASTHRLAVDAAEPDKLLISMAPGQAEQPAHPHRVDGVAGWLEGRPEVLVASPVLLEERAVARLQLVPEPER